MKLIEKLIQKKESAVSPVIGVMLMLVVTIIIAAVVVAFAGGLGGDTDFSEPITFDVTLENSGLLVKALNTPKDMKFGKDYFIAISEPGDTENLTLLTYGARTYETETQIFYNLEHLVNIPKNIASGWIPTSSNTLANTEAKITKNLNGKPVKVVLCSNDGTKIYGTVTAISTINKNAIKDESHTPATYDKFVVANFTRTVDEIV